MIFSRHLCIQGSAKRLLPGCENFLPGIAWVWVVLSRASLLSQVLFAREDWQVNLQPELQNHITFAKCSRILAKLLLYCKITSHLKFIYQSAQQKKPACQTLSELIMEPPLYRSPFLLPPPILPQFRFFGPKNVTPSAADPSRASSLSFPVRPLSELHCQTKTSRNRLRG